MAYLDLAETRLSPAFAAARKAAALFSHRELTVISLARNDDAASLAEPGPLRRAYETMFKVRRANRLADPRLEALRRMVVMLRVGGGNADDAERKGFLSAGYSRAQLSALSAHAAKAALA